MTAVEKQGRDRRHTKDPVVIRVLRVRAEQWKETPKNSFEEDR